MIKIDKQDLIDIIDIKNTRLSDKIGVTVTLWSYHM